MRLSIVFCCLLAPSLFAADANTPHAHKGIVKAYDGEPPTVALTAAETVQINAGTPVYKQTQEGNGGKAVAVFKVNAPATTIWKVLSDFDNYTKHISNLHSSKVYKKDGDKIFAEFTIKVWPTTTTYYIEHNFPMEKKGYGTWKLDYSRLSDLDDSVGFWRVTPVAGHPDQSLVYYSVDVRIKGLLSFIKGFIVDKGLKEATQWVKVASEQMVKDSKPAAQEIAKSK